VRRLLTAFAGALFLLSGSALAQNVMTIRVVGTPNDGYKAIYYGVRAGIFQKYGLDVQPTMLNSGSAAVAALIGGAADLAYTSITAVIRAHDHGVPVQIIAPSSLYTSERPISSLLVLKDSPLHSGRDLNGKTVGSLALGDTYAISVLAWIDQTGGDSHTVKVVEIPVTAAIAALETGRVAATMVNEPNTTQALATGKVRTLAHPVDAIAKRFESGAFAVMAPAVTQNEAGWKRFAAAMHESQLYTNAHLPETVDLVASYTGIAPEDVARSVRFVDPEYVEARNLQPVIDVFAKYGITDRAFSARELISPAALKPR